MSPIYKLKKLNSIRYRILLGFLFITLIYLAYLMISFRYLTRLDEIRHADKQIAEIEALTLVMIKKDNDFFDLEMINPDFFNTRESEILDERETINIKIQDELDQLREDLMNHSPDLVPHLDSTSIKIRDYNERFSRLVEHIFIRGFKDWGLEGEMRKYAHELEYLRSSERISEAELLMLRRHEKDFFLRNERADIDKFNSLGNKILSRLSPETPSYKLLTNYKAVFNSITALQVRIGLNGREGLRNDLNTLSEDVSDNFAILLALSDKNLAENSLDIKLILLSIYLITVFIAIMVSVNSALKLSRPIQRLSKTMHAVVKQGFTKKPEYKLVNPTIEIEQLAKSFDELMTEMELRMNDINEKSQSLKAKNHDLLKLNNELDNFLYSTAHDLRSPLTSLMGLINLVQYENKDTELNSYFVMMKDSVNKMENFISDVVHYAKNNKMDREIEELDLEEMVNRLIEYNKLLSNKDFRFYVNISDGSPVYSDKNRLQIILNNLISNAIKYQDTEKKAPYLAIDIKIDAHKILIKFSDNGIGIAPEYQNKIFNMFFRATELSKGSGLGLFLMKEAVDKLKGTIELSSQPGFGTTFYIILENFTPGKELQKTSLSKALKE